MDVLVSRLRRDCADGGYVNIIQLFPQLTLDMFAYFLSLTCSLNPNNLFKSVSDSLS